MSEFVSRMAIQRKILALVNQRNWPGEPLFGLSKKALIRWMYENGIGENETLPGLLFDASAQLFFLATKSQEQVTENYESAVNKVEEIYKKIKKEVEAI